MLTLDEHADGRTVDLKVGQELEIRLAENPTTGFRWQLESRGEPAGELQEDAFEPPDERQGRSAGHRWRFRAVRAGEGRIALASRRSWETGGSAARRFAVAIRVAA